jgi:hypothetical protein
LYHHNAFRNFNTTKYPLALGRSGCSETFYVTGPLSTKEERLAQGKERIEEERL